MLEGVRVLLAGTLLLSTPAFADEGTAATDVRQSFADYRAAILADEGDAATELVSSASVAYFAEMQRLALYASSEEVRSQSLVNQMQILTFRYRIDAEALRSMTPKKLFAYTIDQGWTGKSGVLELELGLIEVTRDVAVAKVLKDGRPTRIEYRYVRERDGWRWDMEPTLHSTNKGLKMLADQRETSEESLVLSLLESTYGSGVRPTIWNPLFEAPRE